MVASLPTPPGSISIHALREEGDGYGNVLSISRSGFLSTPSARRATPDVKFLLENVIMISIHALREEGDGNRPGVIALGQYFYPRPPRGGRPFTLILPVSVSVFLSTPSARRATGFRVFAFIKQ